MKKRNSLTSEIILVFWASLIIFPLIWVFYVSLKTNYEFFLNPWSLPAVPQFQNYWNAIKQLNLGPVFLNTIYFVFGGLIMGVTVNTLAAFILTRLQWKGKKFILALIMLSLFLPGINVLVPQYILAVYFHLNNSLTGLIFLINMALSAFDILLMSSFMRSIPSELEESARMDGASLWIVFWKIIFPLSTPGIVTISIFRFLNLYNDFINPFIYLTDSKQHTIAVSVYYANTVLKYTSNYVTLFAAIVVSLVPTIVVYAIFQKRVIEGATIGAVKG
jgi:N-acetylglucosamine transport system permease protein